MSARSVALAGLGLVALAGSALSMAAPAARVLVESRVSPANPYVQAAARVTVQIFSARTLYHAELDFPGSTDVVVHRVGTDWTSRVKRDGRTYDVLTRQYLVFGQRSGRLELPGPILSAEVLAPVGRSIPYNNPGGRSLAPYGYGTVSVVPLQLRGKAIALDVRPRPPGTVGPYWVPARKVTLSRAWSRGSSKTHVGDALSLDLTVQAQGLTAEALPDLTALLRTPSGLRAYPDDPKLDDYARGDTLVGRRQQSVALIADRAGRYTLPAIDLRWWDTTHDVERTASLPPQTIVVLPSTAAAAASSAPRSAASAASPSVRRGGDPWIWTTLALALAWVATLGAWQVSGRRRRLRSETVPPSARPAGPGASRSRAAFLDACRENDPRAARRYLLEWTGAEWPSAAPRGLNDLARRLGDQPLASLLRELDRACYAGGDWQGSALAQALTTLPRMRRTAERPPIAPLYH